MEPAAWPIDDLRDQRIIAECLLAAIAAHAEPAPEPVLVPAAARALAADMRRRAALMRAENAALRARMPSV